MVMFMPVVALFITMIGLLIYYCCIGVKKPGGNKHESSACYCSVCVLFVFVTFAITAICIVVYSSMQFQSAARSIADTTLRLSENKHWILSSASDTNSTQNMTGINMLKTAKVNQFLVDSAEWLAEMNLYKFYATLGFCGLLLMHCVFALSSVCCKSRCLLIWSTSVILICIVIIFIYVGIDLMTEVAIADICMEPYRFLFNYSVKLNLLDAPSALYYIYCPTGDAATGLTSKVMSRAYERLAGMTTGMTTGEGDGAATTTTGYDCAPTRKLIESVVDMTCGRAQEGLVVLSCTFLALAIFLTTLACAAPLTWRRFTKLVRIDQSDDESDEVFLRSSPSVNMTSIHHHRGGGGGSIMRTNNPMCIVNRDDDDAEDEDEVASGDRRRRSSIEFSPGTATFLHRNSGTARRNNNDDVDEDGGGQGAGEEGNNLLEGSDKPPPYSPPRPR